MQLPDPLIRARRRLERASRQPDRRAPRRRKELADQLLTLIPPGEQSNTPAVLLDWLARALAGRQPFGSAIKPKTAHDYLHNIAGPLMRGLGDQPLATTTDQQLVTALDTCFLEQSERLKNVQTVDNAARSILRYLRAIHGFEPLDPGDLENWPRSLPTPRAPNFVSEREFERLLRETAGGLPPGRHTRVMQHQLCAAVLIYRAGLRISEIANLVMEQWVSDEQDTLEIRSNSWFELKTQKGKRTVPLGKLLTEQDRRNLTALLRRRQAETRNPEALLFCNHSTGSPYTPEGLARRVRQSLRRVAHDPTMRLHALRHSCGMALFEALIRGRGQPAPTSLPTFHPWLVAGTRKPRVRRPHVPTLPCFT